MYERATGGCRWRGSYSVAMLLSDRDLVSEIKAENLKRFECGAGLLNVVDLQTGY